MKLHPAAVRLSRVAGDLAAGTVLARRAYRLGAEAYGLVSGDKSEGIRRQINVARALPQVWHGLRRYEQAYPLRSFPHRFVDFRTLVDYYDCFFLDIFGTYKTENGVWPDAAAAIKKMMERDKQVVIVSNTTDIALDVTVRQLREAGVEINEEQLVLAGGVLKSFIRERNLAGKKVLCIGTDSTADYLRAAGCEPVTDAEAEYDAILISFVSVKRSLPEAKQEQIIARVKAGAPFFLANADKFLPLEAGLKENTAYILAKKIAKETGKEAEIVGKPDTRIYREAFERVSLRAPRRILCVGDTLWTDIGGAKRFQAEYPFLQVDSLLVLSGTERRLHHFPELLLEYMKLTDTFPTYVLPRMSLPA